MKCLLNLGKERSISFIFHCTFPLLSSSLILSGLLTQNKWSLWRHLTLFKHLKTLKLLVSNCSEGFSLLHCLKVFSSLVWKVKEQSNTDTRLITCKWATSAFFYLLLSDVCLFDFCNQGISERKAIYYKES